MNRYLVVAHQTLDAPELLETMRQRFNEQACIFIWWFRQPTAGKGSIGRRERLTPRPPATSMTQCCGFWPKGCR